MGSIRNLLGRQGSARRSKFGTHRVVRFRPFQWLFIGAISCGLIGSAFWTPSQTAAAHGPQAWLTRSVAGARKLAGRLGAGIYSPLVTGTFSGTAYLDYNQNGALDTSGTTPNYAVDSGVSGVVVTAYNASGVAVGNTTSAADGTYSFVPTGSGPYRLEFTALPSGYTPGASGTNNGTTVRFVSDGGATSLDLGLVYAADYNQNGLELVTNCYVFGSQNAAAVANSPVLISFPYSAGSTDTSASAPLPQYDAPSTHNLAITAQTIGTTFGLAYARVTRRVYAAAFFKRHSGFGPGANGTIDTSNGSGTGDDPQAIYRIERSTGSVSATYSVPSATANKHDTSNYSTDNGNAGWDGVGKTSLGGMDISPDETTLYVLNLENRTLYALNASTGAVITSQAVPTAGVPTTGGSAATAAAGDVRPFAVRYYRGLVYVGLICTGESTNSTNDLFAHVYSVNPTTLAFSASPVFTVRLNYPRGKANTAAGATAAWQPWHTTFSNLTSQTTRTTYAQPVFTDLVFDNGNLIIGLRDRLGDQVGNNTQSNPGDTNLYQPRIAGDILRACGSVAGGWTLESNGRCGGAGSAPQNTGQGPGSGASPPTGYGEFYFADAYDLAGGGFAGSGSNHDEVGLGTMAQLPGALDVISTVFDPIPNVINITHDGGMRWLRNSGGSAGGFVRAYRLYDGSSTAGADNTLGKAAGLGEIELLADPAPIQLGNRVWADTNGNGVQDPGENGIQNVSVQLWADTNSDSTVDTQVGTATTDASGNYYFGGAGNTNMLASCGSTNLTVRVSASSDDANEEVTGLMFLTAAGVELTNDPRASGLRFTNVTIPAGAVITSATLTFTASLSNSGNPVSHTIAGEATANATTFTSANSNVTSRTRTSATVAWSNIGAWTANATTNATSPSLTAVIQEIVNYSSWASGNSLNLILTNNSSTNQRVGYAFDGTATVTQRPTLNITYTCASYVVNPNTAYEIRIPNASGSSKQAALGANNLVTANTDPGTNGDARDSDATLSSTTAVIALTTGDYGVNDHTFDFGFTSATVSYSVGNRVWFDNGAGGGTANDRIMNGGEAGVNGVTVELVDSSGNPLSTPRTTTTNSSGYYRFDAVSAGTYKVRINAVNFNSGGALLGYYSSTGVTSGTDQRDNGVDPATSALYTSIGVLSAVFTLGTASQPLAEPDFTSSGNGAHGTNGDVTDNLQIDFGFQNTAPLAVRLTGFTANAQADATPARVAAGQTAGGVNLQWGTGFEVGHLGFNLYREERGARVPVNASLIAGSALLAGTRTPLTAGNTYFWNDPRGAVGVPYWLEALDVNGSRTWYGPVFAARVAGGATGVAPPAQRAPLLAELNAGANRLAQTESVAGNNVAPISRCPGACEAARAAPQPTAAWTLPNEQAAKLLVRKDGWYRVTAAELQAAGFSTNVNPALLQLWADGVEVPSRVSGNGNKLDFIEFYGYGLDTPATDTRVYWLAVGNASNPFNPLGRRIELASAQLAERANTASFRATVERKDKLIYFSGLLNGDAENWFGPVVNANGALQKLTLQTLDAANGAPATLELTLQGVTEPAHAVSVELNGRQLGVLSFVNRERYVGRFDVPAAWLNAGENEIKLTSSGGSDISLVEAVRLTYARGYRASGDVLNFSLDVGETATLSGFSAPQLRLLHLRGSQTRELTVDAQQRADGSYGCTLQGEGGVYLAQADKRLEQVAGVTLNQPSNWRAVANAADFVIVTHRDFLNAANRLAAARRLNGMRVAVVDVEDAYDEFSFGVKTPSAVKSLLTHARVRWLGKPAYALFMGDATCDPRNYLDAGENDFVPAKLGATVYFETALDNWFADADGDGVPELALGRLPVRTAAQADAVVGKMLAFNLPLTPRDSLFVSDRTVDGVNFKALSEELARQLPALMTKQFANRNDGAPEQVRAQIINSINLTKPLVVNWLGHGSTQVWTGDGLLRTQDAAALTNAATSLFVMTTCLNGYFTDQQQQSLSEAVLLDTPGGAFAVVSSSGLNFPGPQRVFNLTLYQGLFGSGLTLGEALTAARAAVNDQDVRNTYVLFGDPTMRVSARR